MGHNVLSNKFNDLAISKKILVAPIVVIVFLIIIGLFSYNGLSNQNNATKDIYTVKFKNYQKASTIYASITMAQMLTYKIVSWTNAKYGAAKVEPLKAELKKMLDEIDNNINVLIKTKGLRTDESKLLKQTSELFPKYRKSNTDVIDMVDIDSSAATIFMTDVELMFADLHGYLSKLQQIEEQLSGKRYDDAKSSYTVYLVSFLLFLIVSITLSIIISLIIGRSITNPIKQLTYIVTDIEATGIFSKRINIHSKDEIGQIAKAFNTLMESLESAIGAINISMEKLTNGNFDSQINTNLKGDLDVLKNFINSMINNMNTTFNSIIAVMNSMAGGEFTQLNESMSGRFEDLKNSINLSMEAINTIIGDIAQVMLSVANSDLTPRVLVSAEGELSKLKDSINHSLGSISDTLKMISNSTDQVSSSADQTSAAIEQVAQGAQEQVAALSEVATMLKTSTEAISNVSESANQATVFAKNSVQLASNGQKKMVDMVKIINNVSTGSEKISRITEVIGSISSQTNLLSLNAAIEAARAGVHGKGFAVVADEVRKLADDTARSVDEISKLIAESVTEVNKAVTASGEVNKDMENIAKAASDTENKLAVIANEMNVQEKLVKQINDSITNLSDISENNASASEEITATTTNLADMIGETRNQIYKFKV